MNSYRAITGILLVLLTSTAGALDRLNIEVICELAEARYRESLNATQITAIESECGVEIAANLAPRYRFLQFDSGVARDNQLIIRIGKTADEADADVFRAVNTEMWLQGSNVVKQGKPVAWEFRSLNEYLKVPSATTFAESIHARFDDKFAEFGERLIEQQFSNLSIASGAFFLPADGSWLLPFAREDLGLDFKSKFRLRATLSVETGTEVYDYEVEMIGEFRESSDVPVIWHNTVKALHLDDELMSRQEAVARITGADEVVVSQVSVSHYEPPSTLEMTSPSNFGRTGAEQ